MVNNKFFRNSWPAWAVTFLLAAQAVVPAEGFTAIADSASRIQAESGWEGVSVMPEDRSGHKNFRTGGAEKILMAQMEESLPLETINPEVSHKIMNESEIIQLTTEEGIGGEAIITIESSRAIQYTAFKLLNPLRLVLDFPKMRKGSLTDRIEVNKGVVQSIRALRFEEAGVLRLEIALNKSATTTLCLEESHYSITSSKMTVVLPPLDVNDTSTFVYASSESEKTAVGERVTLEARIGLPRSTNSAQLFV